MAMAMDREGIRRMRMCVMVGIEELRRVEGEPKRAESNRIDGERFARAEKVERNPSQYEGNITRRDSSRFMPLLSLTHVPLFRFLD